MKDFRQRRAFTIVEMVIVIAVIAVLAAVMIPTISGVIAKANVSADQQFAASLNVQLAMWEVDHGAIESESDLRDAINYYYGEGGTIDFYSGLTPKSGKQGYHYWYDAEEKQVVLATYDELARGRAAGDYIFAPASLRSLIIGGKNYFLMDQGGSDVIDALNDLSKVDSNDAYADALDELAEIEDALAQPMAAKLAGTAISNQYGMFHNNAASVEFVYIAASKEAATTALGTSQVVGRLAGVKDIYLPAGVTVNMGALTGFYNADDVTPLLEETTELHVNTTEDKLKDIFEAASTDCVIVLPNGARYIVEGNKILALPDRNPVGEDLEVNSIESIDIQYSDSNPNVNQDHDYFSTTNSTLYLAYDLGSAQLSLANGLAASLVNWTVSAGAPIEIDTTGKITIVGDPDAQNVTATVTATLKADASKTDTIEVQLVFPSTLKWKLGNNEYSAPDKNSAISLEYTGTAEFDLLQSGVGLSQEGYVKMNADDLAINFSTSGALFSIADGKLTIDPDQIATNPTQTMTVTYGNAETTYITQEYTVTVIDNSATPFEKKPIIDNDCNDDTCTDKENCTHNDLLMGDTYLFRVGNGNAIKLGSLFNVDQAPKNIKLTIYDAAKWNNTNNAYDEINLEKDDLDATYTSSLTSATWASSTIQFSGTGVAIIRIENTANHTYKELAVEVVGANNVTTYSELKGNVNSVLLNNITMTSNGNFDLSAGKFIYGNGFTFDITNGATAASTRFGIISLYSGAILDNTVVVGATFPQLGNSYNKDAYYVAAVYLNGGTISNSYISGCRTPVRSAGGTIVNTTLQGGKYSNLFADAGTTTIENLTTINQPGSIDGTAGGMGIVLDNSAVLEIKGNLTQYNWLNSEEESFAGGNQYAGILFDIMFGKNVTDIQFTHGGKTWVNTGIFQLKNTTKINGNPAGYGTISASYTVVTEKFTGYAYTCSNNAGYVFNGRVTPATYVPTKQGAHAPTVIWSNDAYKDGKHEIKFDEGQSYEFDPNVLTAKHYGNSLVVNVKMDGVDYTGKKITFNDKETTTHTIVYSYRAEPCYDKDGKEINDTVLFEQKLEVKVTVAKKVGAPTFTFYYGTNGSASAGSPHVTQPSNSYTSTVVQDGSTYYIMPNASATSANAIGSKTINGKTIYYPIVDGINVRSGSSTDYDFTRHYPIFKAVSISDNGKAYSYTATKEMPDTVTWVSAEIDSGNGASALNDGTMVYDSKYVCRNQKKAGNAESGGTAVVKFSYVAEDGNTYYYFVGYRFYDEDEGGACFTPDTLITLADGTQKRVDELKPTDTIIAWDFFTGTYVEKKISLLVNHGEALYNVTNLNFSDGTSLKLIGEHGVFDYDLNKFVYFTAENYTDYIGHTFVKQNLNGGYDTVKLVSGFVTEEYTSAWSVSSAETSNAFASGLLTVAPPEDFYNWIEMSGKLQYNVEQFAADVEKYGLYTYEDFADYVTPEQFVEWNGAYLKIAVEKGYFTFEYILELIEMYKGWMP